MYHTLELCILKTMVNYMLLPKAKLEFICSSTTLIIAVFTESRWFESLRVRKEAVSVVLKRHKPSQSRPVVADRRQAVLTIWRPYVGACPTSLAREAFNIATMCPSAFSRSFPLPRSLSHPLGDAELAIAITSFAAA